MSIKSEKYPKGFILKKNYPNGQLAIYYHNNDGEPIAELSVIKDSIELSSNEIVLKNYSENAEIAHEFLDARILIPTDRFVLIGTHLCPICKVFI